jgi:hypothetical protein
MFSTLRAVVRVKLHCDAMRWHNTEKTRLSRRRSMPQQIWNLWGLDSGVIALGWRRSAGPFAADVSVETST